MYLQDVDNVYDLSYDGIGVSYGDVFLKSEYESSVYNFELANVDELFTDFDNAKSLCSKILEKGLVYPAYEQCVKASHTFNLLQARGAISVQARQNYILELRNLAFNCAKVYLENLRSGTN